MSTEEYNSNQEHDLDKQDQPYQERLDYAHQIYQKLLEESDLILEYRQKVLEAYVDGKPIEYFNKKSLKWKVVKNPLFNWKETDYRIKEVDIPKPHPVQEVDPLSEFITELSSICINFAEELHKKLDK